LRGNVQALRRILQHDEQNVHGRLSVRRCICSAVVAVASKNKPEWGVARSGCGNRRTSTKIQPSQKVRLPTDGQSDCAF
jgi:hypothetical protein